MGRWQVPAALQHKMCSGGGTNKTIGPRPARIDLINNREGGGRPGDVTINCLGGGRGERHNNIVLKLGGMLEANHGRSCPKTQQSTAASFVRCRERTEDETIRNGHANQTTISLKRGGGIFCNFVSCLVFISFYSNNTYFRSKLHEQLDYYIN